MKNLDLTQLNWANSKVISKGASRIKLMHIPPMTFVLYNPKTRTPLVAIESPALTYFNDQPHEEIHDVFMVEQQVILGGNAQTVSEIHLILADKTLIILTDHDRLYIAKEQKTKIRELSSLYSPYKMWGIEPKAPYAFMLLTDRLVDYIDDISEEGQQQQLVYVIWRDYDLAQRKGSDPENKLVIDGEFTRFTAKKFNKVLVVFDLI